TRVCWRTFRRFSSTVANWVRPFDLALSIWACNLSSEPLVLASPFNRSMKLLMRICRFGIRRHARWYRAGSSFGVSVEVAGVDGVDGVVVVAALATLGNTNVAPAVATIAPSIRLDLMERRGVVIWFLLRSRR